MVDTNIHPDERELSVREDIGYTDPRLPVEVGELALQADDEVPPLEPTGDSSHPWRLSEQTRQLGHEKLPTVRRILKDHPTKIPTD